MEHLGKLRPLRYPFGGIIVTKDVNVGADWPHGGGVDSKLLLLYTFVQGVPQADRYIGK